MDKDYEKVLRNLLIVAVVAFEAVNIPKTIAETKWKIDHRFDSFQKEQSSK